MAKGNVMLDQLRGRVGSMVFSRSNGQQIVRAKAATVANPRTEAQVNNRAKFKLMSQLGAAMENVLAFPKVTGNTVRGQFISSNYDLAIANGENAQVSYENLQITNGKMGLAPIYAKRSDAGLELSLSGNVADHVSTVVYCVFKKSSNGLLQYVNSVAATGATANGNFPATMPAVSGDVVIYAYGYDASNSVASNKYGNYQVENGIDVAKLFVSKKLKSSKDGLTETRGTTLYSGETETTVLADNQIRVFVTALGNGSVEGGGIYEIGESVTVKATPAVGYLFKGWKINGSDVIYSTDAIYTFNAASQIDLIAVFEADPAFQPVNVSYRLVGSQYGTATIQIGDSDAESIELNAASQQVVPGTKVILSAAENENGKFSGWTVNNRLVANAPKENYEITIQEATTIVVTFEYDDGLDG